MGKFLLDLHRENRVQFCLGEQVRAGEKLCIFDNEKAEPENRFLFNIMQKLNPLLPRLQNSQEVTSPHLASQGFVSGEVAEGGWGSCEVLCEV